MKEVLEQLAQQYPQLYLDPDRDRQETYRRVVLRGESPDMGSLDQYRGDPGDRMETVVLPTGSVRVVTLGDRHDFELVLRGLMAAKDGPLAEIPNSQGAAMLNVFNWPRIHAHLARFPENEQEQEFKRFTEVRENYIDQLVVLSRGPYSGVDAAAVGCSEAEWTALSDTIRRYHELTHVICRRLYPDDIDPVPDELTADAVGLYAAFRTYNPEIERLFLGIRKDRYVGGRLGNYTEDPQELVGRINSELEHIQKIIAEQEGMEPLALIPVLMAERKR